MADYSDRMKDYVEVKDRIVAFYAKYPEGSLQSELVKFEVDDEGHGIVVMKAWAYRTPDDPRPAVGYSSLEIPGSTPYTKGSEIENAETSAWGRAIAALGFEVKKSIASANEVRNKQARSEPEPPRPAPEPQKAAPDMDEIFPESSDSFQGSSDEPVTDAQALSVTQWCRSFGVDFKAVFGPWFSVDDPRKMTNPQYAIFLEKREGIAATFKAADLLARAQPIINQAQERIRQQNPSTNTNGGISEGKQRRFWAICKSKEVAKQVLDQFGFTDPAEIPWKGDIYDKMCAAAQEANS